MIVKSLWVKIKLSRRADSRLSTISLFTLCFVCFFTTLLADVSVTSEQGLFAFDAELGDNYGISVDISGNRAVVGARFDDDDGTSSVSVYVYEKNQSNNQWELDAKLVSPQADSGDWFGSSVAIDGNLLVVGAPQDNVNSGIMFHGSAFVFTRDPDTDWDLGVQLLPNDDDMEYENYGISVAINNSTLVVGVSFDKDQGFASGSAYVYEFISNQWLVTDKLLPPQGNNQNFGQAVAIDQDTIAVTAPHWTDSGVGEAYLFNRAGGWSSTRTNLPAIDNTAGDYFGWSVGLAKDLIVVGARNDDTVNGLDSGSASVFTRQTAS